MHMKLFIQIGFCLLALQLSACNGSDSNVQADGDRDGAELDGDFEMPPSSDGDQTDRDSPEADALCEDYPDWGSGGDADTEWAAAVISEFFITENPANVLSFFVQWKTDAPALTVLEVDCGEDYRESFRSSCPNLNHKVFVMGLYDGAHCEFKAKAAGLEKEGREEIATVDVGPLPDYLPVFTILLDKPEQLQPGWTLFNATNGFDHQPMLVIMVDSMGRPRWYFRVPSSNSGEDNDVRSAAEGVWIGGTHGRIFPYLINWQGEILWTDQISMHHDLRPWGKGRIMYVSGEKSCTGADWEGHEDISSGGMFLYDMEGREVLWSWILCHHYTPPVIWDDWSHVNTIEPFPGERAMLLSARNQNALFKVDLDTKEIIWKMGQEGDFEIVKEDQFYRQHAPEIQSNGNILLYDNGSATDRPISRVIELAYTFNSEVKEAHVVWSFVSSLPIFTDIWGDADRLDNGNTLATFGQRSTTKQSHLIEISSDNPGRSLWDLVFPLKWGAYRAERLPDPPKGHILSENGE